MRNSVRATYDSAETGPRFWVTVLFDDQVVEERRPLVHPFLHYTVKITWWARLASLVRRHMSMTVIVGGDDEVMRDVFELDDQILIPGRTRHAAYLQKLKGESP